MQKGHLLVGLTALSLIGGAILLRGQLEHHPSFTIVESSSEYTRIAETGALFHFQQDPPPQSPSTSPAALSLTASDGTGLKLVSLDARGVIQGPLAFTEIRLVFENPLDRTLEGTFRITLPQGSAISRFAMKIGEQWQEGEVVEKQAARRAYEDFLHRRQDPALLEQAAGNEFSARVFPIPASGRKELILSYSQEIHPENPYIIPLRGLPMTGKIDAAVSLAQEDARLLDQIHLENAVPDRDLRVTASQLPPSDGVRSEELALFRIKLPTETTKADISSALILVDTSASRALGFEEQIQKLSQLLTRLDSTQVTVAAFDQGIDIVYEGLASGFAQQGAAALRQRQALGASDLEMALRWAKAKTTASRARRILLISDGISTIGPTDPTTLRSTAATLKNAGVERLDTLAVGGIRDDITLRGLCTSGLSSDGTVIDMSHDVESILARLTSIPRATPVKIEGAEWQWPEKIEGVLPGEEALIYAKIPQGAPAKITLNGTTKEVKLTTVDRPLLERAWVGAKIQQLVQRPPSEQSKEAIQAEIVRLSTTFRVLSPLTSLLVLESESDYKQYKIERNALTDILVLNGTKLERQKRVAEPFFVEKLGPIGGTESDGIVLQAPPQGRPNTREEARSDNAPAETEAAPKAMPALAPPPPPIPPAAATEGGLGLNGIGEGGGGKSEGLGAGRVGTLGQGLGPGSAQRLGGDHKVNSPRIQMGGITTRGDIPPEVIQRIVRQSFGRFRLCYENGLRNNPKLKGKLSVHFTLDRNGTVSNVRNSDVNLPDTTVVSCITQSLPRILFPNSREEVVTVSFPITFTPGGETPPPLSLQHSWTNTRPSQEREEQPVGTSPGGPPPTPEPTNPVSPYEGPLADVMNAISSGDKASALKKAIDFWRKSPGDVLALIALGEAFEANGETRSAARAYGSILDLFSSRADLRRMAGERLERLGIPYASALAADSYEKAVEQRPDHPSGHRLLAYARLRAKDLEGAFRAIEAGLAQKYPENRFRGAERILREDAGLIASAWNKQAPEKGEEIQQRLKKLGATLENTPSLRFVLVWETDNNDVDFHIYDGKKNHAYYSKKELPTGGALYEDVTTGYGPECFTIPLPPEQRTYPYQLQAHYYSRGPMGYGMGKLEIIEHDGKGGFSFEQRPFIIMKDRAFVDLGTYPAKPQPSPR